MNAERIYGWIEKARFGLAAALLLIVPLTIDLNIIVAAGPETKFRLAEYGVLLLVLLSLPNFIREKSQVTISFLPVVIYLYIAYCLLRAAFDPFPSFAFDRALQQSMWLVFALYVASVCRTRKCFLKFLYFSIPLQIVVVLYALGQVFGTDIYINWYLEKDWGWYNPNVNFDRGLIWAPLGNPNYYSAYGALVLIWVIALFFHCRSWIVRYLFAAMGGLLIYTMLYTFSRGIWISLFPSAVVVALLAFSIQLKHRRITRDSIRPYLPRIVLVVVVFAMFFGSLFAWEMYTGAGPLHKIGKRFYYAITFRDTSLRTRPLLWHAALRSWKQAPVFGQGYGRFAAQYLENVYDTTREYRPYVVHQITQQMQTLRADRAHNDYVQILAELGYVGFALQVLLLLAAASTAFHTLWRQDLCPPCRMILIGCLAMVIQVALQSCYDFPFQLPASVMFFAMALGGIVHFSKSYVQCSITLPLPLPVRWLVSLLLTVLAVGFGYMILNHTIASHYRKVGRNFLDEYWNQHETNRIMASRNLKNAEWAFTKAIHDFPGDGEILYEYGRTNYYLFNESSNVNYRHKARQALQDAQRTFGDPNVMMMLCTIYIEENRFSGARRYSDMLLKIDPTRLEVQYLAGLVDFFSGQFQDAVDHFRKELDRYPGQVKVYLALGKAYEQLGQAEAAVYAFESALRLDDRMVDPNFRLGELYAEKLNRPVKARMYFQKALDLSAQLPPDQRTKWFSRIELRLRDLQTIIDRMGGLGDETNEQP